MDGKFSSSAASEVGEEWQGRWLVAGSLGARDALLSPAKSIPDTPPAIVQ